MPYNILKHAVLLFPALKDTVPFENQFLEIRFFSNISYILKSMYDVSYHILCIFQEK